jgi:hypothetical protein
MSKHTPGPWKAFRDATLNTQGLMGENGDLVFDVGTSEDGYCPRKADARLIAAAPDLLEACKDMVQVAIDEMGYGTYAMVEQSAIDKIRTAITKAEGGAR